MAPSFLFKKQACFRHTSSRYDQLIKLQIPFHYTKRECTGYKFLTKMFAIVDPVFTFIGLKVLIFKVPTGKTSRISEINRMTNIILALNLKQHKHTPV